MITDLNGRSALEIRGVSRLKFFFLKKINKVENVDAILHIIQILKRGVGVSRSSKKVT